MSKNSNQVQHWRKRTKERIVKAFGGQCAICGYNRCIESLQFHHLDPNEKEATISSLISDTGGWAKVVVEARKCVMLCANCHYEVHAGLQTVPSSAQRFDEAFAEYRKAEFGEQDPCPVCQTLKPSNHKTCSNRCSAKLASHRQFDWADYDLEKLLLEKSAAAIARDLGVSPSAITKRKRALGLI